MSVSLQHDGRLSESGSARDEQIQDVLNDVRARRAAGRQVLDEDVITKHSDLLPELGNALALLKKIQVSCRLINPKGEGSSERNFSDQPLEPNESNSALPSIPGYNLLRDIDRGGQAVVFLAVQESTQRKVAIKVLIGGAFITHRKQDRFEREVKALAVLDHPGIVRIVDRGRTSDGSFFIAMDYVDGEDLDVYLAHQSAAGWNARSVVELFVKIAAALGEAHRLGIVHRDIKPSNVRIDSRGEPRILDFGLARLTSTDEENAGLTVTQTGGVVGSLPWASPEQASGDSAKICPASDVYSLGVTLYRALVGRSPYDLAGTLREQMHNICEVVPTFPANDKASLPFGRIDSTLANVISQCLEKNPSHRYSDGAALATELKDYLAGRIRKSGVASRQRKLIWLIPAMVATLGALTAWTVSFSHSAAQSVSIIHLPTIRNSIGMELILIPAATFPAGSDYTEEGHRRTEELHQVTLTRSYYLGQTEVTRSQYRKILGTLPSELAPFRGDDQLPIDFISRDQAEEFCRRLSVAEERHYRLPTEAEWENACRAGTNTPFSGNGRVDDMAWYAGNSKGQIHAVGLKQPNNWGLYDMEGNVSEWCADQFIDALGKRPVLNPFALSHGNTSGVVRGGNYLDTSSYCRAAARIQLASNTHIAGVGFRVVMDALNAPASAIR